MSAGFDDPNFDPAQVSLPELQAAIWAELSHACGNSRHPWRLPCLATVHQGIPCQRTVVLRRVDHASCQLYAHTDLRTAKIGQMKGNSAVSWLFYHPERRIQLVMAGVVRLHLDDAIADHDWAQLDAASQIPYLAPFAPGTPADVPSVNLPVGARTEELSAKERMHGRENFAVIAAGIHQMDLLFLRSTGHLRAGFHLHGASWQRTWVQP